ncbi:MAG: hypothetical protein KBD90_03475 [Alphaproteobacteria bacterium]|nr:hypothetical protein [Alphaproteobacteria bacterium]
MNLKHTKITLLCAGISFFSTSHQALGSVVVSATCPDPSAVTFDKNTGIPTAPLLLQGCMDVKKLTPPIPPGLVTPLTMKGQSSSGPVVGFYSAEVDAKTNQLTCLYVLIPGSKNIPPKTLALSVTLPGDPSSQQFVPQGKVDKKSNSCKNSNPKDCSFAVYSD